MGLFISYPFIVWLYRQIKLYHHKVNTNAHPQLVNLITVTRSAYIEMGMGDCKFCN